MIDGCSLGIIFGKVLQTNSNRNLFTHESKREREREYWILGDEVGKVGQRV